MKILDFPRVVQIEILKVMRLGELFLLSFASKETRKSIKHLYPKNRSEIEIEIFEERVVFKTGNRSEMVLKTLMGANNNREQLAMLNSGKLHIVVRLGKSVYVYSNAEDFVLKIHKYLLDLINSKSSAFVKVMDEESFNFMDRRFYEQWYNKNYLEEMVQGKGGMGRRNRMREDQWLNGMFCPSVSLILDDSLGKSRVEKAICLRSCHRNDLEIFFKVFPDLKFCMIDSDTSPGGFLSSCRSMNNVDDLIMRTVDIAFTPLLITYRGKNILLERCHLRLEFPNMFERLMKNWKTGKRENLKTFIAYQDPEVAFDPEPYLEVFGDQKWDPKQRQRFYPYESIITDYHKFPADTFDCKDGVDIVRDSDGRRATVKMTPQHFMFFVWPESRTEN